MLTTRLAKLALGVPRLLQLGPYLLIAYVTLNKISEKYPTPT